MDLCFFIYFVGVIGGPTRYLQVGLFFARFHCEMDPPRLERGWVGVCGFLPDVDVLLPRRRIQLTPP